jgi:hypothetical protein
MSSNNSTTTRMLLSREDRAEEERAPSVLTVSALSLSRQKTALSTAMGHTESAFDVVGFA